MSEKYYIAWHPECKICLDSLTDDPAELERYKKNFPESDIPLIQIRQVRIIDEEKVRELWEAFRKMEAYWADFYGQGLPLDSIEKLLQSILPEPKATNDQAKE